MHDPTAVSPSSFPFLAIFSDYAISSSYALDMNNEVILWLFSFSVCISADETHTLESSSLYSWLYNLKNEYCKFPITIKQLSLIFSIKHKKCQFATVIHS